MDIGKKYKIHYHIIERNGTYMKLWYVNPAESWVEALPAGNGRLGAMIYGGIDTEIISLNEDTLWSGFPRDLNPNNKREQFLKAVELSKDKKYLEAQELIEDQLTSSWGQSYLPLGDMILDFKHSGDISNYTRKLDLSDAVASVEYTVDNVKFKREIFISSPDNIMVIKISADKPGNIGFMLKLDCPLRSTVSSIDGYLVLKGEAPSHVEPSYSDALEEPVIYSDKDEEKGMLFAAMAKVTVCGGQVICTDSNISVENADSALILFNAYTSFAGFDVHPYIHGRNYEKLCADTIVEASKKMYDDLFAAHVSDYKSLFDRVSLDLGDGIEDLLPVDKRLYRFMDEQKDPALYTLLFQYGRYLLISSSREGTQPANLQGIWNKELRAPWSSNYTLNINTQMNYWPAFPCGLGELQQPLVGLIKELSITGRTTAKEIYGARGFTSHHNTDIWRFASPVGNHLKGSAVFAFWNVSAGWLCRHLFDQYEYTLDREFLNNEAYPMMKSAAEFFINILTEDKDGYLIISPATSPENSFIYNGMGCSVAATATMSMTIVKELFKNCIKSCEILDCDYEFADELKEKLVRLYPYKTGSKGQLLEWYEEYEEEDQHHRHISHLYGLHPANEITVEDTPELAAACKTSLNLRGDDGTGWSLGWKINQWARLLDGDKALKLLNRQLRLVKDTDIDYSMLGGTYPNMLDAHPPFQIDGNFAATSGIAEMLLQSRDNKIFILPALPSIWENGCVKGLCAKGRIKVNIQWDKESVTAELISDIEQTVMVAIRGEKLSKIRLEAGVRIVRRLGQGNKSGV
jgi:alpha-L-fucosidase 2